MSISHEPRAGVDGGSQLAADLSAYLSTRRGKRVEVDALVRVSNGWESDVYAFEAADAFREGPNGDEDGYILRLYFGADAAVKARLEANAYALMTRAHYPVPYVYAVEPDTAVLGRAFMVLQRVHGVSLGQRWRDPNVAVQQREMARFCALLAQLHTLAWPHLPGAEQVFSMTVAQQIEYWDGLLRQLGVAGMEAGLAWLRARANQVTTQPLGLVHWDFHHENILVDAADRAWVIDWTQFQATDVRFDLAWTLVVLASERDVATAQQVREGYLAARGWREGEVADDLAFFEAAACAKRLASVMISLQRGADSVGMRPGAEEIMRGRLGRIAMVYERWLALTATPMPAVAEMLAG